MKISSNFDSGNIEVLSLDHSSDIRLAIRKDTNSDFLQWFHFRLQGVKGIRCTLNITNAGETSYPDGWKIYQACASYDRENWFRVPTHFDGKNLQMKFTPEFDSVFFAYFAPYSWERHLDLISYAQESPVCSVSDIGETVEGRDINLVTFGEAGEGKKNIWVIARQHPGESMAEWFMEGLISKLSDPHDAVVKKLLHKAVFYLVPNMNPDGSIHGNLRSNFAGANLNREWETPSLDKSPEVFYVRKKMEETGVDLFLDIHGDESIPYNFLSCCEGIPGYSEKMAANEAFFLKKWITVNPEMQDVFGYDKDKPGEANLTIGSNWVGHRFNCLSATVELPFIDNLNFPNELEGWSPDRSIQLGTSVVVPILSVLDQL